MNIKTKELKNKIIGLIVALLVIINSFVLVVISTASDEEKNIVDLNKVSNSINFELEKYVNYQVEGQKGAIIQFNVQSNVEFKEGEKEVETVATAVLLNAPKINNEYPQSIETVGTIRQQYDSTNGKIVVATTDTNFKLILNYGPNCYIEKTEKSEIEVNGLLRTKINAEENNILNSQYQQKIPLEEKSGLISTNIQTTPVYNGYIKTNHETQFVENYQIDISKKELSDETIVEIMSNYGEDNITYMSSLIEKQNVIDILGEEGTLTIQDEQGNVLGQINKDTQANDKGIYKIVYPENISKIFIKISKPKQVGILTIQSPKKIAAEVKDKTVNKIDINSKFTSINKVKNENQEIQDKEIYKYEEVKSISVNESKAQVKLNLDKNTWTNKEQNKVNFELQLPINGAQYNLFKNPTIQIQLPQEVKNVLLETPTIIYGNGLELKLVEYNVEDRVIKVELDGEQTEYFNKNISEGTTITIPATVVLEQEIETKETNINIAYTNINSAEEDMVEKGETTAKINIENFRNTSIQTPTLTMASRTLGSQTPVQGTNSEGGNSVEEQITATGISVDVVAKNGEKELQNKEKVHEGEYIKYEITVTNNTENTLNNITVCPTELQGVTYCELVTYDELIELEENEEYPDNYPYSYHNLNAESKSLEIETLEAGKTAKGYFEVKVNDVADTTEISTIIQARINNELAYNEKFEFTAENAEHKVYLSSASEKQNEITYKLKIEGHINQSDVITVKMPECYSIRGVYYHGQPYNNDDIIGAHNTITLTNIISEDESINDYEFIINGDIVYQTIFNNKENANKTEIEALAYANIKTSENSIYYSNENRFLIKYYNLEVTMTSTPSEGEELELGNTVTYTATITNKGSNSTIKDGLDYALVQVLLYVPEELGKPTVSYNDFEIDTENQVINEVNRGPIEYAAYARNENGELAANVNPIVMIPPGKTITLTATGTVGEAAPVDTKNGKTGKYIKSWVDLSNRTWDQGVVLENQDEDDIEKGVYQDTFENKSSNVIEHFIVVGEEEHGPEDIPYTPDDPENPDNPDTPDDPENPDDPGEPTNTYSLSGIAWKDENEDGLKQSNEDLLNNIEVLLQDSDEKIVNKTTTDNNGQYKFENINDGKYIVIFKYDTNKYRITKYKQSSDSIIINSSAVKSTRLVEEKTITCGVTDLLTINQNIENISIGLIENKTFDFKVENFITKVTTKNSKETNEKSFNNSNLAKVEIKSKEIEDTQVKVEYKIVITNVGELAGTIGEVIDYIPNGMSLNINSSWQQNANGSLVNKSLSTRKIEPGESVELTLVLNKEMTEDTVGTYKNRVEIKELSNNFEIEENNVDNNASSSELIISISTGLALYVSIVLLLFIALVIILNIKFKIFRTIKMRMLCLVILSTIITVGYGNVGQVKAFNIQANADSYDGGTVEIGTTTRYLMLTATTDAGYTFDYSGYERHRYNDSSERDYYIFYRTNDSEDSDGKYTYERSRKSFKAKNTDYISFAVGNEKVNNIVITRNGNTTSYSENDLEFDGELLYKSFGNLVNGIQIKNILTPWFLYTSSDWATVVDPFQTYTDTEGNFKYKPVGICIDRWVDATGGSNANFYRAATPEADIKYSYLEYGEKSLNCYEPQKYYAASTVSRPIGTTTGSADDLQLTKNNSNQIETTENGSNYIYGPFDITSSQTDNQYTATATIKDSSGNTTVLTLTQCNSSGTNANIKGSGSLYFKTSKSELTNKTLVSICISSDSTNRQTIEYVDSEQEVIWVNNSNTSLQRFKTKEQVHYNSDNNSTNGDSLIYNNIQEASISLKITKIDEFANWSTNSANGYRLRDIKFVIYMWGEGWVCKDTNFGNIHYSKYYNNAYKVPLKTYGETETIEGLKPGWYTVFEVELGPESTQFYSLKSNKIEFRDDDVVWNKNISENVPNNWLKPIGSGRNDNWADYRKTGDYTYSVQNKRDKINLTINKSFEDKDKNGTDLWGGDYYFKILDKSTNQFIGVYYNETTRNYEYVGNVSQYRTDDWVSTYDKTNKTYYRYSTFKTSYKTSGQGKTVTITGLPLNRTYVIYEVAVYQYAENIFGFNSTETFTYDGENRIGIKIGEYNPISTDKTASNNQVKVTASGEYAFEAKNKQRNSNLIIQKTDEISESNLKGGFKFKIYDVDAGKYVGVFHNDETEKYEYVGYVDTFRTNDWVSTENKTSSTFYRYSTFATNSSGKTVEITKLPLNRKYQIYEVEIPRKYQDMYALNNYKTTATSLSDAVKVGKEFKLIDSKTKGKVLETVTIKAPNSLSYINLSGMVWEDGKEGKNTQKRNNIYSRTETSNDYLIQNIQVRVVDKNGTIVKDGNGNNLTTTTDRNGKYEFKKVPVKDINNYRIEFTYDGVYYQPVSVDKYETNKIGNNNNKKVPKSNTSKATEVDRDNFNSNHNTIDGTITNGQTVEKGNTWVDNFTISGGTKRIKDNSKGYPIKAQISLEEYYNEMVKSYSKNGSEFLKEIPNLNLGLYQREQMDLALVKDAFNAQVSINNIEYTYSFGQKMNNASVIDEAITGGNERTISTIGVSVQSEEAYNKENDKYKYCLPIYEADVKYDASIDPDPSKKDLNVYITYQIGIANNSQSLYANVDCLTEYFSKNLDWDRKIYSDSACTQEIQTQRVGQVNYTLKGDVAGYNCYEIPIKDGIMVPPNTITPIFIKFELPKKDLNDFIKNQGLYGNQEFRNYAEITGFSIYSNASKKPYAGYDYDSIPNNLKDGIKEDDSDFAPGIKLKLASERKIKGVVFEDTNTGTYKNEIIGDGIRNEDKEKPIQNVKVQLVYPSGKVVENQETMTNEKGEYEFSGFIPGTYKVRFIWGEDEELKTQVVDGNAVTVNDYKSTIVNIANEELSTEEWFLASKQATNYSDAKDNFELRKRIDYISSTGEDKESDSKNLSEEELNNLINELIIEIQEFISPINYNEYVNDFMKVWKEQTRNLNLNQKVRVRQSFEQKIGIYKNDSLYRSSIISQIERDINQSQNGNVNNNVDYNSIVTALENKLVSMYDNIQNTYNDKINSIVNVWNEKTNGLIQDNKNYIFNKLRSRWPNINNDNRYNTFKNEVESKLREDITNTDAEEFNPKRMISDTKLMNLGIEATEDEKVLTENGKVTFTYEISSIDLGLIERPKLSCNIKKQISHIKITSNDDKVLVDAEVDSSRLGFKNAQDILYAVYIPKSNAEPNGLAKVEIDNDLYPLNIEVTYKITIEKTKEKDYMNSSYYWYGHNSYNGIPWDSNPVTVKPLGIYDFIDEEFDVPVSEEYKMIKYSDFTANTQDKYKNETSILGGTENVKIPTAEELKGKKIINLTTLENSMSGTSENSMSGTSTFEYKATANISANAKDTTLSNQVRILCLQNNLHYGRNTATDEYLMGGAERIVITPPTGENKNISEAIIISLTALSAIIVLTVGIKLIKKKVL